VLAAIAVPNFLRFGCRSKQSEAKGNLKAFYVAAQSYRQEHGAFTESFDAMGFQPKGYKLRYRYVVKHIDDDTFTAMAVSGIEATFVGDAWSMNEKQELTHLADGCQ